MPYAWKSLLQAGLRLQFGSDAPVETINPIYGIHAAVTRQTVLGEPSGGWFPEQKLSLDESITGFTAADLTVYTRDLFSLPRDHWPDVETEMTMVHGEVVYQKA